ncbi:rhomboid family intramembrane serine protease [uncultured Roseobacter sp.]|uniref:rhomboid family intramembrane serine protease n=1 Tax=uncultured Roseobacter sp. TaxID=114847 RepID=UPI0026240FD4|nr:rhomboid family intramembrane serine protease [uncultured Roseobacter sp.]
MLLLTVICCGNELVLQLADYRLIGSTRLRGLVYDYGAFWPGLLSDWTPNYTAQPTLMFLTYGLLHGGLAHLAVNMITLWSLGGPVVERVGARGFGLVYAGAQAGGGAVFALLAQPFPPMVGASGALFGLAGALLAWNYVDRFTRREGLWPVANATFWLVMLNLVLWWAMGGQLAWETHLGGFIAGWIMALLVDPRAQGRAEDAEDTP